MKRTRAYLLGPCVFLAVAAPLSAQSFRAGEGAPPAVVSGFGGAVAVGQGDVFIAEPQGGHRPGGVYVYQRSDGGWTESSRLIASDARPGDRYGQSLAVDGNTLLVGATSANGETGAAYVLQKDAAGSWVEVARLVPAGATEDEAVGRSVALASGFAFVAAVGANEPAGAVFLFRRGPAGTWTEAGQLTVDSLGSNDGFGTGLATDGRRAIVGAPNHNERAGGAWIFRHDQASDAWVEETKLEVEGVEFGAPCCPGCGCDGFGSTVLLMGDYALVAAPPANDFTGAVYVFHREADGEWPLVVTLVPFDGARQHRFGSAMAVTEDEVWVGAPGAFGFQGVTYVFRHDGQQVTSVSKLSPGTSPRDFASGALDVRSGVAVVGVRGADYGEGTATIYERQAGGEWVVAATVMSEVENYAAVRGGEVACAGGLASQFNCNEVNLVAFLPVQEMGGARGVRVNDVWGWTDPETDREYALVGRVDGTSFVDITDPANPRFVGNLPKTAASPGSTWRDIKVYHDHAFIVADGAGEHGMQVFDLRQLRNVESAPATFTETAHYDRIHSAHNVVINEATGFAFTVGNSGGGDTCGGGLHMVDVRDPAHPMFAGCFADPSTGRRKTGYTHDAQCVTYQGPDTDHRGKEICFGANETALSIADVSSKEGPVALSRAEYPNVGYAHQGWLTEDQRYFFMDDELDELQGNADRTRTLIWDVSDLDDPVLVKEHFGETSATDHNLYIRGNLMYQSNYVAGLRILDISDVQNPVEVAYFDTVPYGDNSAGFGGSWSNYPFFQSGTIVVTSGREGLFVLKKKDTQLTP